MMVSKRVTGWDLGRAAVEEFLYEEASLLDDYRLEEWLRLFTPDARYVVPALNLPLGNPGHDLMLIDDDMSRLEGRVRRLLSTQAFREWPRPRTRRLVTNVRLVRNSVGEDLEVRANFAVYRVKREVACYLGEYRYLLVKGESERTLRIRRREAILDLESLRPHGTASIIV